MRLYNLFPLLAGHFGKWEPHLERAAAMKFDWVFVNPLQKTGASGSLYSIVDYFDFNPLFVNPKSTKPSAQQLRELIFDINKKYQLRFMTDLVLNHCAADSPLIKKHPEWFVRENGQIKHPYCVESDGNKVVWYDLAQFDHERCLSNGLYAYFVKIIDFFIDLGFTGFRCDAAYQLSPDIWRRLIQETKQKHPGVIFAAETLGCSTERTKQTAQAGFDYVFNSSKWWDFESPWLPEQYQLLRHAAPSISFPESHDTPRLFAEMHANIDALKQRYLFAAVFSSGIMMPMGYEYGASKPLHVVRTRPEDWEETAIDLTAFIAQVNTAKASYPVLHEEGPFNLIGYAHSPILLFWKASQSGRQEALILLNKNPWQRHEFWTPDLYHFVQSRAPFVDLSPEYPLDYVPSPYHFDLLPGMVRVMVTTQ